MRHWQEGPAAVVAPVGSQVSLADLPCRDTVVEKPRPPKATEQCLRVSTTTINIGFSSSSRLTFHDGPNVCICPEEILSVQLRTDPPVTTDLVLIGHRVVLEVLLM